MKGFDLTQEELQELRATHKAAIKNKDAKSAYKLNALILLGSGWKIEEVVKALLFDNNTLRNYVNQYRFSISISWKTSKKMTLSFFFDAVHPTHNTMSSYGWMRKGNETIIQSNSGRSRLNIHSAMNAETYETTIVSNINTDSTISLLEYLIVLYLLATTISTILKYHFSNEVREWVKNNSEIKLVFLPSYLPEYNLVERLWRVFKKKVLYKKYYRTFEEFKNACTGFFENQKNYHDAICSIMGDGLAALL